MEIINLPSPAYPFPRRTPVSAALGNFDGVHLAHQALLKEAGAPGLVPAVFTFERPAAPYLTTREERLSLFASFGIKIVFLASFEGWKDLSCPSFVDFLKDALAVRRVICGFNFRFGRGAAGDASYLSSLAEKTGISCQVLPEMTYEGETISSSAIRGHLAAGEPARAAALLGRPYSLTGVVAHGFSVGKSRLATPTINLPVPCDAAPLRHGVYVTHTALAGRTFSSVTNIGKNPTYGRDRVTCETYLLDAEGDFYGLKATVFFDEFLRPEMKFPSEAALKAAISWDIATAAAYPRKGEEPRAAERND